MNRNAFFDAVRVKPFAKALTQSQTDGMTIILDAWDKSGLRDIRWLAYMLATAFHETARTMQPIREYGRGKGMKYGTTYYGRGFVQLTWKANYQKAKDRFGEDFVGNPDLALRPDLAAKIMFSGMTEGWFTGKELSDYINADGCDYKSARKIINGTDKAVTIAGYAASFEKAIAAAQTAPVPQPAPVPPPPAVEPPVAAPESSGVVPAATAAKIGAIATMFSTLGGWWTLIPVALIAIAVVAYLVYRNRK